MFSLTVDYALRAVVQLAYYLPEALTTEQIAQATGVPVHYLAKVLQKLRDAGIVRSRRGSGGGVMLAHDPARLTVLEVVNAVEPIRRIHTCPLDLEGHQTRLCPLHSRLDSALATMEEAFRRTTVAEMLEDPGDQTPLCEIDEPNANG